MDRNVYREAFHLNDTELDLIAGLVPQANAYSQGANFQEGPDNPRDSLKSETISNAAAGMRPTARLAATFDRGWGAYGPVHIAVRGGAR